MLLLVMFFMKVEYPFFLGRAWDRHYHTQGAMQRAGLSLWKYRPLGDTLFIQDSLRDLRFPIKSAYAYEGVWQSAPYLQFFYPGWILK